MYVIHEAVFVWSFCSVYSCIYTGTKIKPLKAKNQIIKYVPAHFCQIF
jgi:hypothetical protein